MKNINKFLLTFGSLSLAMTLTACSNGEKTEKHDNNKEKQEATTDKQDKPKQESNQSETQKNENKKNDNSQENEQKLDDKTKLALAFFAKGTEKHMLSRDEVLTGVFTVRNGSESEKKQLYKLVLSKEDSVVNAPQGMKFYKVYPSIGNFTSIIGISDKKIIAASTQSRLDYKQLLRTGKEFNTQDLYKQFKNNSSLPELANKIEISNQSPAEDKEKLKDYEEHESTVTMAHYRSQIYQIITEFNGQPIDTDKYLVDNVKQKDDGGWLVNYRDKRTAEIVGTFTTEGENKIVKKDVDGNVIKEKTYEE